MRRPDLVLEIIVVLFAILVLFDTFGINRVTGMAAAGEILNNLACPVDAGLITAGFYSKLYESEGHTTTVYPHHTGIDIAVGCGTPVKAAYSGTAMAAYQSGWGNQVIINHDGVTTMYAHLQWFAGLSILSKKQVAQGEVIGYVGSTGKSTGCHLHFEIQKDGSPINPRFYSCFDIPCEPGGCDETQGEIEAARQKSITQPQKPEAPELTGLPKGTTLHYEIMPSFRQSINYSLSDYEQLGLFAKDIVDSCSGSSDADGCVNNYDNRYISSNLYLKVGGCDGDKTVKDKVYRFCGVSDRKLLVHDKATGETGYRQLMYKFALRIG